MNDNRGTSYGLNPEGMNNYNSSTGLPENYSDDIAGNRGNNDYNPYYQSNQNQFLYTSFNEQVKETRPVTAEKAQKVSNVKEKAKRIIGGILITGALTVGFGIAGNEDYNEAKRAEELEKQRIMRTEQMEDMERIEQNIKIQNQHDISGDEYMNILEDEQSLDRETYESQGGRSK